MNDGPNDVAAAEVAMAGADVGALERGDVVSLSFADAVAQVYGVARLELVDAGAVVFVAVFGTGRTLAASARLDRAGVGTSARTAGGLALSTPVAGRLSARFAGADDGEGAFELDVAISPWPVPVPVPVPGGGAADDDEAAGEGGAEGSVESAGADETAEVPGAEGSPRRFSCAGEGSVRAGGETIALAASGQLRMWRPAPQSPVLVRELDAWFASGRGLSVHAVRASGRGGHDRELMQTVIAQGDPRHATAMEDTRLSTVYGADGAPRRVGLELWASEESDYARRAAGEAVLMATAFTDPLSGGRKSHRLRADCAFMGWRMEGEKGIGPYTLIRTVPAA